MGKFISTNIKVTENKIDTILNIEKSFDLLKKNLKIGDREAVLYFVNGFCKEDVMEKVIEYISTLKKDEIPSSTEEFANNKIPYIDTVTEEEEYKIITAILSGVVVLVVDKYDKAILMDAREYPARSVSEPEKYKVLRGSRDGFVETLIFNTALIRRRIRDPKYICEIVRVGDSSRTDIAVCYIEGRADENVLKLIKDKLKNAKIDALSMNQESLSECIYTGHWFNPFPKFRFTERPDTVAASILEGQIAVLVDNSPAAMLLPTTVFDAIEEADDYYFAPITGTYLRVARASVTIISLILTPIYLLFAMDPSIIPGWLEFTRLDVVPNIPIYFQLMILEFGIDGLKLAAINTPNMLNTPLSLIAAIIIGEFAINTGWFLPQTMLYMAVVAIANFVHENYEFAYALKFMRIFILTMTFFFGLKGFIIGVIMTILIICCNRTIANTSYIYPLYPFDFQKLCHRFFRVSLKQKENDNKRK